MVLVVIQWRCGANVGNGEWTGNAGSNSVGIPNSSSININSNRGLAGTLTVDSGAGNMKIRK
jgi:hypothetical protein